MRLLVRIICVVVLGIGHPFAHAEAPDDETPDAYEIVAATAVPALPLPLREFYQTHLDRVQRTATAGLVGTSGGGALPGDPDWHYIMLDVAAGGGRPAQRHTVARSFPRTRSGANAFFKRYGRHDGGSLPWVISDRCHALGQTFRSGDVESVVRETGILVHFATDAALPFNTTTDREGVDSGNLHWPPPDSGGPQSGSHHTVRHRCQVDLIHRLRSRLDYEVRVSPERYAYVHDPLDAVFDTLVEAHGALGPLLAADAEAIADLGITDGRTFAAATDAYYDRLADGASAIMESRLESAALLAAKLIGTAWTEAGSPSFESRAERVTAVGIARPSADDAAQTFVGSRTSSVFHRASCAHAKRIKRSNQVFFSAPDAAREAGRTPCKTCRPDEPNARP